MMKLGRNEPCHCGSGKKYKKCCLPKDQETEQEQIIEERQTTQVVDTPNTGLTDDGDGVENLHETEELGVEDLQETKEAEEVNDFDASNEALDAFWVKFEPADFNEKIRMVKNAFHEPFMDNFDEGYEIFLEVDESIDSIDELEQYTELVLNFKTQKPECFHEYAIYILEKCLEYAIVKNDQQLVEQVFLDMAKHGHDDIDIFNWSATKLAYHGYLEILLQGYRIGWEKIKNEVNILPWGIEQFAMQGEEYELLSYLESEPAPFVTDEKLTSRMEHYTKYDKEVFAVHFSSLSGKAIHWKPDDFAVKPNTLSKAEKIKMQEKINFLTHSFFNYLWKEIKFPATKAFLLGGQLRLYLRIKLYHPPKMPKRKRKIREKQNNQYIVLLPDARSLEEYLIERLIDLYGQGYDTYALLESIPYWLAFLEKEAFISHTERKDLIQSLLPISTTMIENLDYVENFDKGPLRIIRKVWQPEEFPNKVNTGMQIKE